MFMTKKILNEHLKKACSIVGGQRALAKHLNVSCPTVNQWVYGIRPVPFGRCAEIERVTDGEVSRKDLCPDNWQTLWPELAQSQSNSEEAA